MKYENSCCICEKGIPEEDIYHIEENIGHLECFQKAITEYITLKDKLRRKNKRIKELKTKLPKIEFDNNHHELDSYDLEEMAKQVQEGYTSGHLNNGEGKNIYWELKVNVWKD